MLYPIKNDRKITHILHHFIVKQHKKKHNCNFTCSNYEMYEFDAFKLHI